MTITLASSQTEILGTALNLASRAFGCGNSEQGFHHFRQLPPAHQNKIYELLWIERQRPRGNTEYGKFSFHDMNGLSSTTQEKAAVINKYLSVHFPQSRTTQQSHVHPTIQFFLDYKRREIDEKLHGIFLKYFRDTYPGALSRKQEALGSAPTVPQRSDASKCWLDAIASHVCNEIGKEAAKLGATIESLTSPNLMSMLQTEEMLAITAAHQPYTPVIWRAAIEEQTDIRYKLLASLIERYATPAPAPQVSEHGENSSLDALIRKHEFSLRVALQIQRIDGKFNTERSTAITPEEVSKEVARAIDEASSASFFDIPEGVARSYGITPRIATPEDLDVSNCLYKLSLNPLLREKFTRLYDKVDGSTPLKLELFFRVICPLFDPSYSERYGQQLPNGILFYGPPGCGKTHVSKALAEAMDGAFVNYSPGANGSPFVNQGSMNIHELFLRAEQRFRSTGQRTVIFMDEADSVLPRRDLLPSSNNQSKIDAIDEFLRNMESCSDRGVLVICATNFKHNLDPAAVRDGRIDMQFEVPPPSEETRKALFKSALKRVSHIGLDINFDELVRETNNLPPSSIKAIAQSAINTAARSGSTVSMRYLRLAIIEVRERLLSNPRFISL